MFNTQRMGCWQSNIASLMIIKPDSTSALPIQEPLPTCSYLTTTEFKLQSLKVATFQVLTSLYVASDY